MPYVSVHVDACDVLDFLGDEELFEAACERRSSYKKELEREDERLGEQVESLLLAGDAEGALLLVQRWLRPKFADVTKCMAAAAQARIACA